jgi:thiamine-monophosphate kinase
VSGLEAPLGPGREFDLIRSLVRQWGPLASGIGDDAAVLGIGAGEQLVVSTDTSVEDVHFRRGWLTPREIGYRAAAAAVSDLAAMAARPVGMVIAMSLPETWRGDVLEIGAGIGECSEQTSIPIVGGDMSKSHELSITLTVLGGAIRPLRRNGARPGDLVYVTGRLGGPQRALEAWLAGDTPRSRDRERFARPVPRVREAMWLAEHGATAAIDISDGLVSDLAHIAAASNVDVGIDLERLPLVDGASSRQAVASGEEYELAITAPHALDTAEFERQFGIPLTSIGQVAASQTQPRFLAREGGTFVDLSGGYDHFSS